MGSERLQNPVRPFWMGLRPVGSVHNPKIDDVRPRNRKQKPNSSMSRPAHAPRKMALWTETWKPSQNREVPFLARVRSFNLPGNVIAAGDNFYIKVQGSLLILGSGASVEVKRSVSQAGLKNWIVCICRTLACVSFLHVSASTPRVEDYAAALHRRDMNSKRTETLTESTPGLLWAKFCRESIRKLTASGPFPRAPTATRVVDRNTVAFSEADAAC